MRVLGSGADVVVFVHGWMVSSAVFAPIEAKLGLTGRRLAFVDLPGAGARRDDAGPFTIDAFVASVVAALDALGADDAIVVGHSMGGQLALALAARHPKRVRAVCAVTPVPLSGLALDGGARAMFASAGGDRAALRRIVDMATKALSDEAKDALVDDAMTVSPACVAASLDAWTAGVAAPANETRAIVAPTLVAATDDAFLPPALLQREIVDVVKGARLSHIPGVGHYPQWEAPAELADVINRFLAEHRSHR